MAESKQKVVLVTGCSSGIGLDTAVSLAKDADKRFKVYATMRNLGKKGDLEKDGSEVLGKTLFIHKLDVTSDDDINKVVDELLAKEGRIDVLLNNAGFGWIGAVENHASDNISNMFATNVLGPIKLTQKLLPHWKKAKSGHVITVTSTAGIMGFPFMSSYAATKFAIEGFSEALACELCDFENIHVSTIIPGPVSTKFGANADFDKFKTDNLDEVTAGTIDKFNKYIATAFTELVQKSEDVANVILEAITASKPHLHYITNHKYDDFIKSKFMDPTGDEPLRKSLQSMGFIED